MPMSEAAVASRSAEKAIPSRERILLAAKRLFARNGYENTSTIAVARDAGTSESQLMKHFGSKQGLLEAILDRGWVAIVERVRGIPAERALSARLLGMLQAITIEMENDPELKELMTLEAHRVRKDSRDVLSSAASRQFSELMDSLLSEMREQGKVRPELNLRVVRTALVGMVEGLLREQVVAARSGARAGFDFDDVNRWLESVVPGFGG
jgi:AcrR family transcriptional regulator